MSMGCYVCMYVCMYIHTYIHTYIAPHRHGSLGALSPVNLGPFVLTDELWTNGGNPRLRQSCSVCGGTVLLKDEATWKQFVTVCHKTWKQTLYVVCGVHCDINRSGAANKLLPWNNNRLQLPKTGSKFGKWCFHLCNTVNLSFLQICKHNSVGLFVD